MKLIKRIPASSLHVSEPPPHLFGNEKNDGSNPRWTNKNWLKSRFHFSFAEYHNPKNSMYGVLRVMNDDLVQGERGFGAHPHRDMEIVTYIVNGALTHQDSMGTRETLGRGSVQFMTAGTGVMHSEHNLEADPLRFIQIWIVPRRRGLAPNYGGFDGTTGKWKEARSNSFAQIVGDSEKCASVTGSDLPPPVLINQDVSMHVSELEQGKEASFSLDSNRQAYLLCVEGSMEAQAGSQTEALEQHDAAEVRGNDATLSLNFKATSPSCHILLLEMAKTSGDGRKDF